MNREIEFRGKRKDNGKWVYGYLYLYHDANNKIFYNILNENEIVQICTQYGLPAHVPAFNNVIPETIGQYTGLKDKNGKKIFEGDFVKERGKKLVVKFDEYRGGYFPFACGDGCGCCEYEVFSSDNCEVIGTIFDKEN